MADEEESELLILDSLSRVIGEISALAESRGPLRRSHCDLGRRIKLLNPLVDELMDGIGEGLVEEISAGALLSLLDALVSAKDLLLSVNEGSKLYQALQNENYVNRFQEVTEYIEKALSGIPYDNLAISEEVKEQIQLVHSQFRRAKQRVESPDLQLLTDLAVAQVGRCSDPIVLKRLSEKLQLTTLDDMKKESLALHEMVISSGGNPEYCLEEMSSLLKNLKDSVLETQIPENFENGTNSFKYRSPMIPDDFRCPMSLELMRDPVIVSTGQTYERSCIQKWLDSGHKTCPKTQQNLPHTALTPNFVLKGLIGQWCEANGMEPPKKHGSHGCNGLGNHLNRDRIAIDSLLQKMESGNQDEQRAAAGELRLLAKRNADNRICIAEAGAIPLLVELLSSPDLRIQEHAVTALLNLSINEGNKSSIVDSGAIPEIVEVLKNGSMEARENAAATLFSLSVIDGNKVTIGAAGAIPALIELLCQGSPRGKKDAATAIFNLAIFQGNKARAVKAGIVGHLMRLLVDPAGGMVDQAIAILALLSSHPEGKAAIATSNPVPVLVEVMRTGSPRNRENSASVLWALCTNDTQQLKTARDLGAEEPLKELVDGGTDRAKRKAASLLQLMRQNDDEA